MRVPSIRGDGGGGGMEGWGCSPQGGSRECHYGSVHDGSVSKDYFMQRP